MFGKKWKGSERKYEAVTEHNVGIRVRDGTRLNADIVRPASSEKFPAILGVHPYDPDQSPPIKAVPFFPSTAGSLKSGPEKANGPYESGDSLFYAQRGYAHIVCNVRGTGLSEGKYPFFGSEEVQDIYDAIEWIGTQEWCNGNVGMFGISYFAMMEKFVAALNPPHLKCIFAPWALSDLYRHSHYHGGILHFYVGTWRLLLSEPKFEVMTRRLLGPEGFAKAIQEALNDPELNGMPEIVEALRNPDEGTNPLIVDVVLNKLYNSFWEERTVNHAPIKVPSYIGADWAVYGIHLPGAFHSWDGINAPKKMTISPPVPLDRPLHQLQYESLRWFDYWLKGIDNGVMDTPPVNLYVMGSGEWRAAKEWPLPETVWFPFYLHENSSLSEHELRVNEGSDSYEDSPWSRGYIEYYTPRIVDATEVIGPSVLNLYASSTDEEILWLVSLRDVDSSGNEKVLTRGWLRGSHREIDESKSKPWEPYHPHNRSVPLVPNKIYEFNIAIVPTANLFKSGHKIGLRISSTDDPPSTTSESLATKHIRRQKPSRITVFHSSENPSNVVLPITRGNVIGTWVSAET
ncbi:MAG: CocE/NonD family hydrolase [Nitrososphaerales archaeon]